MQKDIVERLKEFPTLVKLVVLGDPVSAQAITIFSRDAMLEIQHLRSVGRPVDDAMISRALQGFDCGTGDPNDYKRRMRFALEAALQPPHIIGGTDEHRTYQN